MPATGTSTSSSVTSRSTSCGGRRGRGSCSGRPAAAGARRSRSRPRRRRRRLPPAVLVVALPGCGCWLLALVRPPWLWPWLLAALVSGCGCPGRPGCGRRWSRAAVLVAAGRCAAVPLVVALVRPPLVGLAASAPLVARWLRLVPLLAAARRAGRRCPRGCAPALVALARRGSAGLARPRPLARAVAGAGSADRRLDWAGADWLRRLADPDWPTRTGRRGWPRRAAPSSSSLAPLMPRPPAICLSSGSSLPLSPPRAASRPARRRACWGAAVVSVVSDT